jgi:hypothetical protein
MARMVVVALMVLALAGGPHGAAAQGEKPTIAAVAGVYMCEGQNPDGTAYKGIVEIVKFHDSFLVRWTLPEDVSVIGVGIQSNGVLAVSYYGGAPGVIVYRIDGNRMLGEWTMGGTNGGVFSETLTRIQEQERQRTAPPADDAGQPRAPERRVPTSAGGTRL